MGLFSLFDPIQILNKRIEKFSSSKHCPDELRQFYKKIPVTKDTPIKQCQITSIDFETTGLDIENDQILSIGGIDITRSPIQFNSTFHYYIKNKEDVIKKESAVINQITPELLANGKDISIAIYELLEKISGKIILVHCSYIECGFIRKILKLRKKDPLPFLVLDTMEIERKLNMANPNIDVRLSSIRERRNLPEYEAHNALIDSLATADVFLAQIKDVFKNTQATILPIYKRSL